MFRRWIAGAPRALQADQAVAVGRRSLDRPQPDLNRPSNGGATEKQDICGSVYMADLGLRAWSVPLRRGGWIAERVIFRGGEVFNWDDERNQHLTVFFRLFA